MSWLIKLLSTILTVEEGEYYDVKWRVSRLLALRGEEYVYSWLRCEVDIHLEKEYPWFMELDLDVRHFIEALVVDPYCAKCRTDLHLTNYILGNAWACRIGGDSGEGFELLCTEHCS